MYKIHNGGNSSSEFLPFLLPLRNIGKYVSTFPLQILYVKRCVSYAKRTTARSSTFHFARASQNKKSFHFPTATQKIN